MSNDPSNLETVFGKAIAIESPQDREAYLNEACGDDSSLRGEIEKLVADHFKAGDFLEKPVLGSDITLDEAPLTEGAGTVIGRYKLLEQIGEGGMGVVYMAEQTEPVRRRVALKIIKIGMDTRQVIARFEAERQALALMDHPNIARILDAGATETGRPYFVMELVKGIPITEYCDKNHLTGRQRLDLFNQVCGAVQHAHQKGIIHRDIKPTNVMVTLRDGKPVPKIIDFGIAKATNQRLTEKTLFTNYAQMIGTPAYMSPEQAEMSALDVDTRSDIYSLGALLYELLTGATPFDEKRLRSAGYNEIQRIIREEEPVKPSTCVSTLGEDAGQVAKHRDTDPTSLRKLCQGDLDWIVMKALEKDRTRRYETANGLAADIGRYLSDEPVVACPPSAGYRFKKFARRNRAALTAAALIAVALLLGTAISTWQAVRATKAEGSATEQARKATTAARNEARIRQETRRQLYVSDMGVAHSAVETANLRRALQLLDRYLPRADKDEEDLRTFEWYYLWRRCHRYTSTGADVGWKITFSPDGRTLAAGRKDGAVKVLDIVGGRVKWTAKEHGAAVTCVAFSPDGGTLASSSYDGTINLWQAESGKHRASLSEHTGAVMSVAFSPDGSLLASASLDTTINVWEVETGELKQTLSGHELPIYSVAFSPDGTRLASAGGAYLTPSELKIWDVATGIVRVTNQRKINWVLSLAFSPDGTRIATGGRDRLVRTWDANTGKLERIFGGREGTIWIRSTTYPWHSDWIMSVSFSPDGATLASASCDRTVKLWDAEGHLKATIAAHGNECTSVAFSPSGTMLASADEEGLVKLWDVDSISYDEELPGNHGDLHAIALSPDDKLLAVSSGGSFGPGLKLIDATSGKLVATLKQASSWPTQFSPDGRTLASSGENGTIELWDVTTGSLRKTLNGHRAKVSEFSFSPDGRMLASASGDGTVRLWEPGRGDLLKTLESHNSPVASVRFSPDGKTLASGARDGTIKIWNVGRGREFLTLQAHRSSVSSLAFSGDGTMLASGGATPDYSVKIWDAMNGTTMDTLNGHSNSVHGLAFFPDGKTLASVGWDKTIRFWNIATGQEVMSLGGHDYVWDLAISRDGGTLMTAGAEGQIRLWRAATENEVLARHEREVPVLTKHQRQLALARHAFGLIQMGQEKYDEAEDLLKQAAKIGQALVAEQPDNAQFAADAAATLAAQRDLYWKMGQLAEAISVWEEVIKLAREGPLLLLDGGSACDWFFLAMAHRKMDHQEEARTWYDKAVEWTRSNDPLDEELHRLCAEASKLLGVADPFGAIAKATRQPLTLPAVPTGKLAFINLGPVANLRLDEGMWRGMPDNNLGEVPQGRQTFAGVDFEIGETLIQLTGTKELPTSLKCARDIQVGRKVARLYVLHGTQTGWGKFSDQTEVGFYIVHYEDGTALIIPIVKGKDIRDWWNQEDPRPVSRAVVGWQGSNPASKRKNIKLRLYVGMWKNPHPAKQVTHIDYVLANTSAHPFCVAMTVEEPAASAETKGKTAESAPATQADPTNSDQKKPASKDSQ